MSKAKTAPKLKTSTIRQELETIRKRHHGVLKAADVVEFARNDKTALHSRFTWNDTKAAHEHRLWQARTIIRVTVEVSEESKEPLHVYVSLSDDRKNKGGGYRSMVDVVADNEKARQMMDDAYHDFQIFERKYRRLDAIVPEIGHLKRALELGRPAATKAAKPKAAKPKAAKRRKAG